MVLEKCQFRRKGKHRKSTPRERKKRSWKKKTNKTNKEHDYMTLGQLWSAWDSLACLRSIFRHGRPKYYAIVESFKITERKAVIPSHQNIIDSNPFLWGVFFFNIYIFQKASLRWFLLFPACLHRKDKNTSVHFILGETFLHGPRGLYNLSSFFITLLPEPQRESKLRKPFYHELMRLIKLLYRVLYGYVLAHSR